MARHWKIAVAVVVVLAVIGVATLPPLLRNVLRLQRTTVSDEQARQELDQAAVATPSDKMVQAQLFWASATSSATLEASPVSLPLSNDPTQRSKQLIIALITKAPGPAQRTLPAGTELLQFYLLPGGTAVANFSEALSMETPSGILSEQMAVDSLVRTLAENVSEVHQLKILIRGQETETLAGHVDLTGFFPVESDAPAAAAVAAGTPQSAVAAPAGGNPASATGAPAAAPAATVPASSAAQPPAGAATKPQPKSP